MVRLTWTLSNTLSLSRIVLAAPIGYCLLADFPNRRLWAAAIIVLAVSTDFLDGYFARKLHEVSELGKVIDPLADKISVATVGFILVWTGDLPLWFMVAVLLRDLLILLGGAYIKGKKNIITQSNWPGKIAVSAVAFFVFLSTLRIESLETLRTVSLWISILMMVYSTGLYSQRLFIGPKTAR